jgi:hypothetical protein
LSASPSPAFAPWGIPEELEDDPPEDELGLVEVCELGAAGAALLEVVWLGLDPQPAATRAMMRTAPAASRRTDESGRKVIVCSFEKAMLTP